MDKAPNAARFYPELLKEHSGHLTQLFDEHDELFMLVVAIDLANEYPNNPYKRKDCFDYDRLVGLPKATEQQISLFYAAEARSIKLLDFITKRVESRLNKLNPTTKMKIDLEKKEHKVYQDTIKMWREHGKGVVNNEEEKKEENP